MSGRHGSHKGHERSMAVILPSVQVEGSRAKDVRNIEETKSRVFMAGTAHMGP